MKVLHRIKCELGKVALQLGIPSLALPLLVPAAEAGDAETQLVVGLTYGKASPPNYAEAIPWLQKSADQRNSGAQRAMGIAYANGLGVSRDRALAAKWDRRAAEQGDSLAQIQLGRMCIMGDGTVQDYAEAFKWLSQRSHQGDATVQSMLGW